MPRENPVYQAGIEHRVAVQGFIQFPRTPFIPANVLNVGLAATDGKQYSFFVRN
jgi:hypothetical protein